MQNYKAPDNSLHAIEPDFAHLLPAGCVPITEAEAEALRPKPTHAELVQRTLAKARSIRLPILSILDGMQASRLANDDRQAAMMVEDVKTALRNITSIDLSGCTTEQEMQMAIFAAYIQIRAQAPEFVHSAFSELAPL
jgi:hypothetical protein